MILKLFSILFIPQIGDVRIVLDDLIDQIIEEEVALNILWGDVEVCRVQFDLKLREELGEIDLHATLF